MRPPLPLRRPTDIADVVERLARFRSDEAMQRGLSISVRPDDVFVATYPKSGTTWLQHVVHGLRSRGSMDFDEITGVVPWLESAWDMGVDPDADQPWCYRAFKSHLDRDRLPAGGRVITALRHPLGVLVSFYRFFEGWFFEPGTVTLDEFAAELYLQGSESGRHWDHIRSWMAVVDRPDVLVLAYEDMVEVSDRVPAVVARFLEIDPPDVDLDLVVRQSSRDFMTQHHHRFDEHLIRAAIDERMGLPPGPPTTKISAGSGSLQPSPSTLEAVDAMWRSEIAGTLGFATYEDLRRSLPNPLEASRR